MRCRTSGTDSLTLGHSCSRPPRLTHTVNQVVVVRGAIVGGRQSVRN